MSHAASRDLSCCAAKTCQAMIQVLFVCVNALGLAGNSGDFLRIYMDSVIHTGMLGSCAMFKVHVPACADGVPDLE